MDGFAIAGSDALLDGRFGNPFAGASHLCASLKVLDLNTEGFPRISVRVDFLKHQITNRIGDNRDN